MRKLLWCCLAVAVLAVGSLLSGTYYACCHPESLAGRFLFAAARASVAMHPMTGLVSLSIHANVDENGAHGVPGAVEECIPDEPQPVAPEPKNDPWADVVAEVERADGNFIHNNSDPIIIREEDPMPRMQCNPNQPATIDMEGIKNVEQPATPCPIVMPYCQDDDEQPITPPHMLQAGDEKEKPVCKDQKKSNNALKDSAENAFEAWTKLFQSGQESKSEEAEELPLPQELSRDGVKCQEDCHRHEHYSGCPHMTCPYTGKSCPVNAPAKKMGKEETSEEPATKEQSYKAKTPMGKDIRKENHCPAAPYIDTMEYRRSDGGLNEYGPGPYH